MCVCLFALVSVPVRDSAISCTSNAPSLPVHTDQLKGDKTLCHDCYAVRDGINWLLVTGESRCRLVII